ncbi:hypothetical protein [Halopiger goleimassiliensis]|uniref:hypothetical protein n=1 Tax=Halopiger goleimassiliensis TaxID=1293048 RepID=UPI000677D58C|nr:hypothetical protein [Halopiger goleimassiliensis]
MNRRSLLASLAVSTPAVAGCTAVRDQVSTGADDAAETNDEGGPEDESTDSNSFTPADVSESRIQACEIAHIERHDELPGEDELEADETVSDLISIAPRVHSVEEYDDEWVMARVGTFWGYEVEHGEQLTIRSVDDPDESADHPATDEKPLADLETFNERTTAVANGETNTARLLSYEHEEYEETVDAFLDVAGDAFELDDDWETDPVRFEHDGAILEARREIVSEYVHYSHFGTYFVSESEIRRGDDTIDEPSAAEPIDC